MVLPEEMYHGFNRVIMSALGLWPYNNVKVKQLCFISLAVIQLSFLSAQLLALFTLGYNDNNIPKILSTNISFTIFFLRYISFKLILKNVKVIVEHVIDNWNILTDNQEIEIICKYRSIGKLLTSIITIFSYICYIFALLLQYFPNLLDIIKPLNVSRPHEYFIQIECFIDQQKYFHIIAIYINIVLCTLIMTMTSIETFILQNALYAFGLFKISSYRMQYILSGSIPRINTTERHVASRNKIIAAVDIHRRAIELSELLKETFGPVYLILVAGVIVGVSINLFYLFRITFTKGDLLESIRCTSFIILHLVGLFAGNYAGQQFINYDTNVYQTICNTQWYNAPLRTQKLIFFLIQKTSKCYKVDAGGMFYPSLEGFASGLSMSISYFMVLCTV